MGVRFPSTFALSNGNPTGTGGETVMATTATLIQALAGQVIQVSWSLIYTDGAAPITPAVFVRRGNTTGGALVYSTGTLSIGANGVIRMLSGMVMDVPGVEISTPYSLTFNNANGGTSVAFSQMALAALAF